MWFQRISYVGELGWEIYIPTENSKEIYELIITLEKKFGLVHAGAHAMDIMRMEKGYLHWGHDISPAENPYEAGLAFALKLNKKEDFIGKGFLVNNKNIHSDIISEVERSIIQNVLIITKGNQLKASEMLGLNRNTLRKKIGDLNINIQFNKDN